MKVKLTDNTDRYLKELRTNLKKAGLDIKNDFQNTARSAAPHKSGVLEKGINSKFTSSGLDFRIVTTASAVGSNGYDYAAKMHNTRYALGQGSVAKGSGKSGISGKTFSVGSGYLAVPADQNFGAYVNHIGKAVKKSEL